MLLFLKSDIEGEFWFKMSMSIYKLLLHKSNLYINAFINTNFMNK